MYLSCRFFLERTRGLCNKDHESFFKSLGIPGQSTGWDSVLSLWVLAGDLRCCELCGRAKKKKFFKSSWRYFEDTLPIVTIFPSSLTKWLFAQRIIMPFPVGQFKLWCYSQSQWGTGTQKWQTNYPWERAEHFRRVFKKSFYLHWYFAVTSFIDFYMSTLNYICACVYTHWVELNTFTIYRFSRYSYITPFQGV